MARADDRDRPGPDLKALDLEAAADAGAEQDAIVERRVGRVERVAAVLAADHDLSEAVLEVGDFLGLEAERQGLGDVDRGDAAVVAPGLMMVRAVTLPLTTVACAVAWTPGRLMRTSGAE